MKKNLYFSVDLQRRNLVKEFFMSLFLAVASYPRLLLEVFLRKNMGERYFSVASVVTVFILLAALPFVEARTISFAVIANNFLYYLFLAVFLYMSSRRFQEISRLPSVFDFGRYSLAKGEVHPLFFQLRRGDEPYDIRTIQTILEPSIFFIAGVLLISMDQKLLGGVLAASSVMFSLSYYAAFDSGDHKVMDEIDKIILSEEMVKAFVDDEDPSHTRGVQFFGRKPADRGFRQRVMNNVSSKKAKAAVAV